MKISIAEGQNMRAPVLEKLCETIPLVQQLLIDDVGFAINSTTENIAYLPGKNLKIYTKTSYEIRPGDPIHPGLRAYRAVKENRKIVEHVEAQNSVYGIPYTVVALPICSSKDSVVGSLVMVFVRKIKDYREEPQLFAAKYSLDNIIGNSDAMLACKERARKMARSSSTVLITGETGVGKELFAHSIHNESDRNSGPFVRINCAAIPEALLEAELFGYEEGSFTGARKGGHAGKFELAEGGTIFLDEIGDMPVNMQVKLLRILQEREFERLGSKGVRRANLRVVAATNANLETLIRNGKFRSDLYFRLNVLSLNIPSLRQCKSDIPLLIEHFRGVCVRDHSVSAEFSSECIDMLCRFDWPGNIRELGNVVEKMTFESGGNAAAVNDIPSYIIDNVGSKYASNSKNCGLSAMLDQLESEEIRKALLVCNGNKTEAAKLLKIAKVRLYRKMQKYCISLH